MRISSNLWCKSILLICDYKLYISSSVSCHTGASFNVPWMFVSIYFSVRLFLAMPCKSASKEKWQHIIMLKKPLFTFFTIDYREQPVKHDQTMNYLTENSILYRHQSGLCKNHSTDTSPAYLTDKILTGFDSGLLTGMILIDLQKAFDTINHNILLREMSTLRFSDRSINWFQSYLSNRSFRVNVQGKYSCIAKIDCWVPQGSIGGHKWGPLLFLLYFNDMKQAVDCDFFLYADDSWLVYQHKDVKEIERNLSKNFSNVWLVCT